MTRGRVLRRIVRSAGLAALVTVGVTASMLGAATTAGAVVLPRGVKMTLPHSVAPSPDFMSSGDCGVAQPNDSATCNALILRAIANARKTEPLAAIPGSFNLRAFDKLSAVEQIFAIADIERTARGLPPMAGITAQLDAIAAKGASGQTDPSTSLPLHLTTGGKATAYGSNWAEGTANALGADYFWMYDDGLNSPNSSCTKSNAAACWGHRKNVLFDWENSNFCPAGSKINILMGVGEATSKVEFSPSITEIFVNDCGALPTDMVFTWPDVQKLVFGH
jgi:hypothetical protein